MDRGSAFHAFVERAIKLLIDTGEISMPGDVAKDLAQAVMDERTDLVLPESSQDQVRLMAWNFATATVIDSDAIVGLEQTIEADVGKWTIRGRLDLAQITPFGYAEITDFKTSLATVSAEELERGTASWQAKFYAYIFLFGRPEGESLGLGEGLNEVRFTLSYPRWTSSETGELVGRTVIFTRTDLNDYRRTLESHLDKLETGLESGHWPAVPGSHCSTCAAPAECPIPAHLRPIEDVTPENREEMALRWEFTDREQRRLKRSLREDADENGPIPLGSDQVLDFRFQESRIVDWEAANGGPIDPAKHVKVRPSTVFAKRKLTPDEQAAA